MVQFVQLNTSQCGAALFLSNFGGKSPSVLVLIFGRWCLIFFLALNWLFLGDTNRMIAEVRTF